MTEVNLTKDPIIMLLLQNIIRGAARISLHDMALNQQVTGLKYFLQHPSQATYEDLVKTIDRLISILQGYDLAKETGEEQEGSLPSALYHFKQKLEELKTQTELNNKHFSLAELDVILDRYVKLAEGE